MIHRFMLRVHALVSGAFFELVSCGEFLRWFLEIFMCMVCNLVGASGALVYLQGLYNGFMCKALVHALTAERVWMPVPHV